MGNSQTQWTAEQAGMDARTGGSCTYVGRAFPALPCVARVVVKSPVRENRPPGSVRGAPGNRRPYRDDKLKSGLVGLENNLMFWCPWVPVSVRG